MPYQALAWSQLHVTHFDQRGQTLYDSPYSFISTKSPFTVCKSMLFSLSWWTWRTLAWSSRFCFTVALKYVSGLRRALKLLSETHESFTKFVYTPLSARSLALILNDIVYFVHEQGLGNERHRSTVVAAAAGGFAAEVGRDTAVDNDQQLLLLCDMRRRKFRFA